jgi:hypothetical protein
MSGATPRILIIRFVVGEDVETHLGSNFFEGPGQEVGASHPGLEGPERMLDGLSSDAHGVGHALEPGLHLVEHAFVLPALDPLQLVRGASGFERAGEAGGQVTVVIDVVLAA